MAKPKFEGTDRADKGGGEKDRQERMLVQSEEALANFLTDREMDYEEWEKYAATLREEFLDGWDLLRKETLYRAVKDVVDEYNERNPEANLTILMVYHWILGDFERAEEEIDRASKALPLRRQERRKRGRYRFLGEKRDVPSDEPVYFEEKMDDFLIAVSALPLENINFERLKEFIQFIKKIIRTTALYNFAAHFERMFEERTRELAEYPENADAIIKCMISSVKCIYDIAFDETQGLSTHSISPDGGVIDDFEDISLQHFFDEEQVKREIILDYDEEQETASVEGHELMSNCDGRIKSITFMLGMAGPGNWSEYAEPYFEVIGQLLEAKKDEKDFVVKCLYADISEKDNLIRYFTAREIDFSKIVFVPAGDIDISADYSLWIRDGAVRRNDGAIIQPFTFYKPATITSYANLIPVEDSDLLQSSLVFQGGNMRATDSYLFIGYDDIYETARNFFTRIPQKSTQELDQKIIDQTIKLFEKQFGKEVVVLGMGEFYQDIFHIDMCITPLNDRDIIVGEGVMNSMSKVWLDEVANDLLSRGFNVIRMPYYAMQKGDKKIMLTYNNALIENYIDKESGESVKKVYLPQYYSGPIDDPVYSYTIRNVYSGEDQQIDLEALNAQAAEIYRSQGFTVVPIAMSVGFLEGSGSLDCITFEEREN